jgi:hypothetical protein
MANSTDASEVVKGMIDKIMESLHQESQIHQYDMASIELVDCHAHLVEPNFPRSLLVNELANIQMIKAIVNVPQCWPIFHQTVLADNAVGGSFCF